MKHLWVLLFVHALGCPSSDGNTPALPATQTDAAAHAVPPAVAPPTFADVVEKARPAVVNIYTRKRVAPPSAPDAARLVPQERLAQSLGSGFIIDAQGHVLTNFHVIEDAQEIEVRLFDERWFKASVVGDDAKTDLALLKLADAKDLPVLPLGDSDALRVGDWVIAIGNPLGLTSTVTVGIASATGRKRLPLNASLKFQDFIQTDASINPGNSGGPLVALDGTVVGINAAVKTDAQGLGFAIPANMVAELLPKLKAGGHVERGWLGIYIDEVPKGLRDQIDLPATGGALITGIVKGGPGETAKLRPGDVIIEVDRKIVTDASNLAWLAGNVGVGNTAQLSVRRGNESLTLPIVLGAPPSP